MRFPRLPNSEKLIQSTLDLWGPLYKEKEVKELTKADAKEILTNLFGYLNALAKCAEDAERKKLNATERWSILERIMPLLTQHLKIVRRRFQCN